MSVDPNWDARQIEGSGTVGVARTPLQVNPAWNCWSAVSGRPEIVLTREMAGRPFSVVEDGVHVAVSGL